MRQHCLRIDRNDDVVYRSSVLFEWVISSLVLLFFQFSSFRMNLSWLSLECVIPHLDANKRLMLSICYKSFRKLEKRIAIELDKLIITRSEITINKTRYQFGEIQDIRQIENITERKRKHIEYNNSRGGVGWMNRKGAVLEPGDVELNWFWGDAFLEAEKYEFIQSVRRIFMSALERFHDSKSQYNPLHDLMNHELIDYVLETIGRESGEVVKDCNVDSLLEKMNAVKLERDELSVLYPKAFKSITDYIEELKNRSNGETKQYRKVMGKRKFWIQSTIPRVVKIRLNGEKADILMKLAYPQMIYPHFNQLTVFNDDSQDYHNRLPDGLSLRQAFKQFSTVLLGRRNKIHVREFRLMGKGIIPLPVGFQIDCVKQSELLSQSGFEKKLLTAYSSAVKYVDRIHLPIDDEKILRLPLIQNCRIFEIFLLESSVPIDAFSDLLNEVLILKTPRDSAVSPLEFFNEWLKNKNRKIGSKFIIGSEPYSFQISLETSLFEIGFRKTPGSSSYYRPLSGGKKAVLDVVENILHHLPPEIDLIRWNLRWNYPRLDFCYFVEIVGSE